MIQFFGPSIILYFWSASAEGSSTLLYIIFALIAYTSVCFLDRSYQRDGKKWKAFQRLGIWSYFRQYFRAGITTESSLDNDQQYIFCSFPHGACKTLQKIFFCSNRMGRFLSFVACLTYLALQLHKNKAL